MDRFKVIAPVRDCPDCLAGKHDNCTGDAWNVVLDAPARCPCQARGHTKLD